MQRVQFVSRPRLSSRRAVDYVIVKTRTEERRAIARLPRIKVTLAHTSSSAFHEIGAVVFRLCFAVAFVGSPVRRVHVARRVTSSPTILCEQNLALIRLPKQAQA